MRSLTCRIGRWKLIWQDGPSWASTCWNCPNLHSLFIAAFRYLHWSGVPQWFTYFFKPTLTLGVNCVPKNSRTGASPKVSSYRQLALPIRKWWCKQKKVANVQEDCIRFMQWSEARMPISALRVSLHQKNNGCFTCQGLSTGQSC